jgi:hypothetical protein
MGEGLEGGCTCGRVRYRLREDPIAFYACHCTDCQRESGSAFGLSMIVRREAIEPLQGELRLVALGKPDGRESRTVRCAHCGTRLWSEPVEFPQVRTLRPGTLDDPRAYEPFGNMWTASAHAWASFAPGPRFERQPEDPLAMVRIWQERPRAARQEG